MNEIDIITVKIQWNEQAQSLAGKTRVLIRFPSPQRNGYEETTVTGEDVVEIATAIAEWILELATS